jgi:signal transduction histidine kinase/ActR/RegA family two-component response regulator
VVLAGGLLAVGFALAVAWVAARQARHDALLAREADGVRLLLLRSHLSLEERLAGDLDAVAGVGADRRELSARLRRLTAAAEGDVALRRAIDALSSAVARVLAAGAAREGAPIGAIPGTPVELAYDAEQLRAEARLAALGAELERHGHEHRRAARALLAIATLTWGLAVVVAAAALAAQQRRRERAEAALRDREHALAVAQRMEAVGQLAGGMAHDLNNALAAVRAHCELARDKAGEPPARLRRKMDLALASVLRASSLLERLLAFARRQAIHPESLDVGEVVGELARVLGSTLGEGVRLELAIAPDRWMVEADLASLEQVVTNLFVNAADALGGRGTLRIATENLSGAAGEQVALTVSDDGPGIAAELRERIFEPFVTTKEAVGRSGLGLTVVRSLVEQAGGRIEVESEPGHGATFRVLLPRARPRSAAVGVAGGGERLLLVDEDEAVRTAVASLLGARGYEVTAVAGMAAALEAAEREPPYAAVVTDVRLADGSGPELVAELRRRRPVRALYMSGYTDRIVLRQGPGRGEAFFLKKPFSGEGLARMLRDLLAGPAPAETSAPAAEGAAR